MSISQKNLSLLQYIPARLVEGKEWFICYYAVHPDTGYLKRIRIKFNRIQNTRERKIAAKNIIRNINEKLAAGWNPFVVATAPKSFHYLFNVLDTYLSTMKKEAETHSYRSYKSYIKWIKNWLLRNNYNSQTYVSCFSANMASDIMLEIKEDPNKSLRTYNNYLQFFTTLFNWLMQFNYIAQNPFIHLKKVPKKKIQKNRRSLSIEERHSLQEFIIAEKNFNYLAICYLCYYCCLRPNEISLLRVKDINLKKQYVHCSAEISKNDNSTNRTIPDVAMPILNRLNLNYPEDYYLFSMDKHNEFIPGIKRAEGREIARYWSDVIRPALKWPMELKFYSLKDTGITNMLADGIAANFVQGQADHSSLAITSIYAVKVNKEAHEQIKKLATEF